MTETIVHAAPINQRYRYLVVEGPIGVGKTSLAQRLANQMYAPHPAHLLLERADNNPFLEKFYKTGKRYALPTQLHFLSQRITQLRGLLQHPFQSHPIVSDFLFDKDPLFAQLILAEPEFKLYETLLNQLRSDFPQPDLVIYLQAKPEVLLDRIQKRGIAVENNISKDYLRKLCEAYSRFFYNYDHRPVLIINTETLNPLDSDEDFKLLLERIHLMRGQREYFNRAV